MLFVAFQVASVFLSKRCSNSVQSEYGAFPSVGQALQGPKREFSGIHTGHRPCSHEEDMDLILVPRGVLL